MTVGRETPTAATDTRFSSWNLPNGLRVILASQPWSRSFSASLGFPRGWRHEPENQHGVTHLLEHLAFAGENRSRVEQMSGVGVSINGVTKAENTFFFGGGHHEQIELVLDFYANVVPAFPIHREMVERELSVLEQERLMTTETPFEVGYRRLMARLLEDEGLGRPEITPIAKLREVSLDALRRRIGRLVTPAHACLVIVGPYARERLESDLVGRLGTKKGADPEPVAPKSGADGPARERPFFAPFRSAQALVGIASAYAPRNRHPLAVVVLLNHLVGGGPHSLLHQRVRGDAGLAYHVSSEITAFSDRVILMSSAVVSRRTVFETHEHLEAAFDVLRRGEISPEMFEDARGGYVRNLDCLQDSPADLCEWLAHEAWSHPDADVVSPAAYQRQLRELRLEEARTIAEEIFERSSQLPYVLGPLGFFARRKLRKRVE